MYMAITEDSDITHLFLNAGVLIKTFREQVMVENVEY